MKPTTLTIKIRGQVSAPRRILDDGYTFFAILFIPVVNDLWLGGGWALDLFGTAFGMLIAIGLLSDNTSLFERARTFATAEEAADWVRNWGNRSAGD